MKRILFFIMTLCLGNSLWAQSQRMLSGDNLKIVGNTIDFYTNKQKRGSWTHSGSLLIGSSTDNGNLLQVNGGSYFNGPQLITGTTTGADAIAHSIFTPTITSTGTDWQRFYGMRISPTLGFSSSNQQAYALSIEPTWNLNGTTQYTDAISAALHVSSNLGGIKIDQSSSTPGNSGQPLFIEQNGTANKECIYNYRNNTPTTRPFIWHNDNRPVENRSAMIPAIRSTIALPEAGGGTSFTLDRYYYGTEASIDMKYETTPSENTASTINTSIAFNTRASGVGATPLYLRGKRVGIGTTNPLSPLHIVDSTSLGNALVNITSNANAFPRYHITNSSAGSNAAAGLLMVNDANQSFQLYMGSTGNAFVPSGALLRSSGPNGLNIVADAGPIAFGKSPYMGANEFARFLTNGSLGIGNQTPTAKLHVVGTGIFTDTLTATTMNITDNSNRVATTAFVKSVTSSPALTVVTTSSSDITATVGSLINLPDLGGGGNHIVILPDASAYTGQKIHIRNLSNYGSDWAFDTAVTLPNGTTSTAIINQTTIELISDGAAWIKWK